METDANFTVQPGQIFDSLWPSHLLHISDLPGFVQVGPVKYLVRSDHDEFKRFGGNSLGHTDSGDQVILINPDQGEDQKRTTLLHEVLHAVWNSVGLSQHEDVKDHEEVVVSALEYQLLDVLQRNPVLVAYLVNLHAG